jgi:nitroimidazol reductase NimA-like FMN-containing flavoprotein (pyridoxamine 5'-phosphate oxidase superfamily)
MPTQMTREEIDAFLDTQRTLILVTLRRDGAPVAHAMWFTRVGSNLYVDTQSDSFKARNCARDDRVCALVESGERYFDLRGVRIEGRCRRVEDPDELERVRAAQDEKAARIGSGIEDLPDWFAKSRRGRLDGGSRVVLRIPMDRLVSWDFSKVRERYARKGE